MLVGRWDLSLPVESWRAWYWHEGQLASTDDWGELPDAVLCVYVYHPGGKRTRMVTVDHYPPPPGAGIQYRAGIQLGEVNSEQWREVRAQIEAEA